MVGYSVIRLFKVGYSALRTSQSQCGRIKFSAGCSPGRVADCYNVYRTLQGLLICLPGPSHLRTFILCCTNVQFIIIRPHPMHLVHKMRPTATDAVA